MSLMFGLGGLFQVSILLVNAIAILSEDRFLARIGWSAMPSEASFGGMQQDQTSIKAKIINLISSVRTLMRLPLIVINALIIIYSIAFG